MKITLIPKIALTASLMLAISCSSNGNGNSDDGSSRAAGYSGEYGALEYEGQTYKIVVIGTQTWMAENLNYATESGSACYSNSSAYCEKYGMLYDWATAMDLPSSCNYGKCIEQIKSKHQGICPSDWHIPSNDDWSVLIDYAGGSDIAGKHLKATSDWETWETDGEDTYGFAALPGGKGFPPTSGGFYAKIQGFWWSSSEFDYKYSAEYDNEAYLWDMNYAESVVSNGSYDKEHLYSIRCIKD